jgi:hypothetical protein
VKNTQDKVYVRGPYKKRATKKKKAVKFGVPFKGKLRRRVMELERKVEVMQAQLHALVSKGPSKSFEEEALRDALVNDMRQLPLKKLLAVVYSAHPELSATTWDAYDDVQRQFRHENIKLG